MEPQSQPRHEHQMEQEQEQEQHPYMSLYEPSLLVKTEPAEADACLSSLSQQQQQQQQQPDEIPSYTVANQSPVSPPRQRINPPMSNDIERAKKRQKTDFSDVNNKNDNDNNDNNNNNIENDVQSVGHKEDTRFNLKEQTLHILKTFLDNHEDDTADDVDGCINNADSFNSIENETESTNNIERVKLATKNNKKIHSKPHSASTATVTATATATARSIGKNLNGNCTDSGIAATTKKICTHDERWMRMYERFVEFQKDHKDTQFPRIYEKDPKLYHWVNHQRKTNKNKMMLEYRECLLNSIDFVWEDPDTRWIEMYERLVAYKIEHNSTIVPKIYKKYPKLASWVKSQRKACKNKTSLTEERKRLLNAIDFVWDVTVKPDDTTRWMEMYQRLVSYKIEHNDTYVPARFKKVPKLGHWVQTQRIAFRKRRMTEERKRLLTEIGFAWELSSRHKMVWDEMYQRLVAYKTDHNHTNVPQRYTEDGRKLGAWVQSQRTAYRENKMMEERKCLLHSIGFLFH